MCEVDRKDSGLVMTALLFKWKVVVDFGVDSGAGRRNAKLRLWLGDAHRLFMTCSYLTVARGMKMTAIVTVLLSEQSARILSGDLIAVAAILVGFGLTVIMFRLQRELYVQEQHPQWPNWLAWSDYLILASMLVAVFFVVLPILAFPVVTRMREALASAACISAIILQVGYIPAILAHYRIEIGRSRTGDRQKGEPTERLYVYLSIALRTVGFIIVFYQRLHEQ
jgi:hypothetical protein